MPEMAARPLHLCLPLQKIPREARLLQEAHLVRGREDLFVTEERGAPGGTSKVLYIRAKNKR